MPAAPLIYQHPSRAAGEAIARSLDESLRAYHGVSAGRDDQAGGPAEGPDTSVTGLRSRRDQDVHGAD